MYCSQCGKEIPDNSEFCGYCGATIASKPVEAVGEAPPPSPQEPTPPPVQQYAATPPAQPVSPPPAKKRSALPWILGAAGLAAVVAVVLVLVFVVFAGEDGMSLSEYRKAAGDIHTEVGDTLGGLSDEFEALADWELTEDVDDAIASFAALRGWVDSAEAVLEEGLEGLGELDPPSAAESLHRELIAFYEDSMGLLDELRSFALYMEELLSPMGQVIVEFEGLDSAVSAATTPEEVVVYVQEMNALIVLSLEELSAISPPASFATPHGQIVSLWEELGSVMGELAEAIETEDLARMEQLEARMSAWEAGWDDLGTAFDDLGTRFYEDLMEMAEEGADFADRIEAL